MDTHAIENIRYIRETMERASAFTAVPGAGGVAMGLTGSIAAFIAPRQTTVEGWMLVWMIAAVAAIIEGALAMLYKARATGADLLSAPARKFALSFVPPMAVGGLLTIALWRTGTPHLIAGTWLGLYGAAIVAGGVFSVRVVPVMGAAFIGLSAVALLVPALGDICMGLGFGGLQILFGLIIARRYGG
jgi:hypothetical protein